MQTSQDMTPINKPFAVIDATVTNQKQLKKLLEDAAVLEKDFDVQFSIHLHQSHHM